MKLRQTIWLLLVCSSALAGSTTIKQIDTIKNSSGGSSLSVPSGGSAFISNNYIQDIFTTCNGSNTTFTLSQTPVATSGLMVFLDALALIQGASNNYTVSGTTLTLNIPCATGQKIMVVYVY